MKIKITKKNIVIGLIGFLIFIGIFCGLLFAGKQFDAPNVAIQLMTSVGVLLTGTLYLPQVIHTIKVKKADQLSWLMISLECIGNAFWITGSALQIAYLNIIPINIALILVNLLVFSCSMTLIVLKYKWQKRDRIARDIVSGNYYG